LRRPIIVRLRRKSRENDGIIIRGSLQPTSATKSARSGHSGFDLAAVPLPRGAFFYDVDHSLATPQAFKDRQAWLMEQLFGE
jgi:hypothetical protein